MSERIFSANLFSANWKRGTGKDSFQACLMIGAGALGFSAGRDADKSRNWQATIVDRDYIEASNLQRQQLYTEQDVEQKLPKAAAAEKRLQEINSDVEIISVIGDAESGKA